MSCGTVGGWGSASGSRRRKEAYDPDQVWRPPHVNERTELLDLGVRGLQYVARWSGCGSTVAGHVATVGGVRVLIDRLDGGCGLDLDAGRAAVEVDTRDHAAHRPARQLDGGDVDGDDLAGLLDDRDLRRALADIAMT